MPDPTRRSYTLDEALDAAFNPIGKIATLDCGTRLRIGSDWFERNIRLGARCWCNHLGDDNEHMATVTRIEDPDHAT